MSTQTIAKLKRLLEIERAKTAAAQAEAEKFRLAYNEILYEKVDFEMRCEQAMRILQGERE